LLGHEGHGEVLECGEGVKHVKSGDNVVLHWRRGLGIESEPPKYFSKGLGLINAGWVTTFNEYAVISENRLTSIPSYVDKDYAALMGCAVTTALGTLTNDSKSKVGESIAIFGCGGVGLSLIQFAKLSGCYPIIGVDIHENKLKHAKSLGATQTVNSDLEDFEKLILDANEGSKIDVCIDNTGIPEIIETAYSLTSPEGGRTVLVGVMDRKNRLKIWTYPLHFNQKIIGSSGGQCKPNIDIPKIIKLVDNNLLDLKCLIVKTYTLEEINLALHNLRTGDISGRLIIRL
jgi:Zn-dependent alcohol dehydrogenase